MTTEIVPILSKSVDEFVPKNRWIASLSNGETIFDDNRVGEISAWERLATYVEENGLAITQLRAQVAGSVVTLPPKQDAYIQYKKVEAWGSGANFSLCIGFVQGNRAKVFLIGENKCSRSIIIDDPGKPKTIYRCDKE